MDRLSLSPSLESLLERFDRAGGVVEHVVFQYNAKHGDDFAHRLAAIRTMEEIGKNLHFSLQSDPSQLYGREISVIEFLGSSWYSADDFQLFSLHCPVLGRYYATVCGDALPLGNPPGMDAEFSKCQWTSNGNGFCGGYTSAFYSAPHGPHLSTEETDAIFIPIVEDRLLRSHLQRDDEWPVPGRSLLPACLRGALLGRQGQPSAYHAVGLYRCIHDHP